jgi:hypothetical protein
MDLRELMIGDWVMYTSDKPENAFPVQVTLGMFNNEFVKWPNRFEPILIDENIVKNNFDEWDGGYGTIKLENDITLQFYLHEFRLTKYAPTNNIISRNSCHYVHELQHAVKLMKIDREIKL